MRVDQQTYATIPQIFGKEAVPLYDVAGNPPTVGTYGYVSFIAGDAAFPVWLSSSVQTGSSMTVTNVTNDYTGLDLRRTTVAVIVSLDPMNILVDDGNGNLLTVVAIVGDITPEIGDILWVVHRLDGTWVGFPEVYVAQDADIVTFSPTEIDVQLTTASSPGWFPGGTTITILEARLGTAGSTDTVVTFYKNGVSIGTVTVAAGETQGITEDLSVEFLTDDEITCAVTTAGTGAKNLTASARSR